MERLDVVELRGAQPRGLLVERRRLAHVAGRVGLEMAVERAPAIACGSVRDFSIDARPARTSLSYSPASNAGVFIASRRA
jgi:hypothetical protein